MRIWKYSLLILAIFAEFSAQELIPESILEQNNRHPIVYLVATPCSGLVETLRMMHERQDINVMHIPANLAYCYVHNYVHLVKGWYREDAPISYSKAAAQIDRISAKGPVIVGENTHTAMEFLADNPDFANRSNMQYIFLIGDPHDIILSYYDKKKGYFDEMPEEQIAKSVGYKELYAFILSLKEKNQQFFIYQTNDLYQQPKITVQKLCAYLRIPYMENTLHWKSLIQDFQSLPFWTIENKDCSLEWHSDAIASTGFPSALNYTLNENAEPTFEEVINEKHRKTCKNAYIENKRYYDLITLLGSY